MNIKKGITKKEQEDMKKKVGRGIVVLLWITGIWICELMFFLLSIKPKAWKHQWT